MGIGKRIEQAMIKAKKKPVDIAKHLKISESAVSQWFAKDTGPKTVRLSNLAAFLGTTVDALASDPEPTLFHLPQTQRAASTPPPPATDEIPVPPLQVFASAAGGPEGAWVLSSDAIALIPRDARLVGVLDAFACYVMGDSMEKAYEQGNLLLVKPGQPPSPGDDVLLVRQDQDGTRYALIKRLVRSSDTSWTVKQWNPEKTYSLPKAEWQQAMLVIGKYNRG